MHTTTAPSCAPIDDTHTHTAACSTVHDYGSFMPPQDDTTLAQHQKRVTDARSALAAAERERNAAIREAAAQGMSLRRISTALGGVPGSSGVRFILMRSDQTDQP